MYSDINKCFIQFMLNKGCVDCEEADKFITTFLEHTKEQVTSLETVISELNQNISDHLFRLIFLKCEVTGKNYCCLVNTGNDDISRVPVEFTATDYELFRHIVKEILISDTRYICGIYCLNLISKCKTNQSKDETQKKINKLCDIGYLVKKEGNIYLGPRTILEYEDYFKQQFADKIVTCHLCSTSVYFGEICSLCNHIMHVRCMDLYRSHRSDGNCPKCRNPWEASATRRSLELSQTQIANTTQHSEDIDTSESE